MHRWGMLNSYKWTKLTVPQNNSTDLNGESQGEAKLEYLLRKHDEEKIKRCNDDIDSLLVFVCHLFT